jgi:hypothetical protein
MQFQGNSKNSRDWAVRVNWHGKKSYYWSKHSPYLWAFPSTDEAIFSTDFALSEGTLSIAEMLLAACECLSPHYEWAE